MRRRRELIAALALASAACSGDRFISAAVDAAASDAASDAGTTDGGTDAVADAPSGPRVSCGASTCKPDETCCVYTNPNNAKYACNAACPPPQNSDQLSALKCSGTADCPSGQVCCIERPSQQNVSVCSATPCGGNLVQLCDPSAQDAGCPGNAPCSSNNIGDWKLPSAFGTCGGLAVP